MAGRNSVSVRILSLPSGTGPTEAKWVMGNLEAFLHEGDLFLRIHDEQNNDHTVVIAPELLSGLVSKAVREGEWKSEKDGKKDTLAEREFLKKMK